MIQTLDEANVVCNDECNNGFDLTIKLNKDSESVIYGFACFKSVKGKIIEEAFADGVTDSIEIAQHIMLKLISGKVSPITFYSIIDDIITSLE